MVSWYISAKKSQKQFKFIKLSFFKSRFRKINSFAQFFDVYLQDLLNVYYSISMYYFTSDMPTLPLWKRNNCSRSKAKIQIVLPKRIEFFQIFDLFQYVLDLGTIHLIVFEK